MEKQLFLVGFGCFSVWQGVVAPFEDIVFVGQIVVFGRLLLFSGASGCGLPLERLFWMSK